MYRTALLYLSLLSLLVSLSACVGTPHERRTTGTLIEDEAIELKAQKAFFLDKALFRSTHLSTVSFNNYVLLVGQAPTEALKFKAEQLVRDIRKVIEVYNHITIAAPSTVLTRTSDSYITSKVKSKMLITKAFDPTRVKVVTENGVVYLLGLVSATEEAKAIEISRKVGGVQRVVPLFQFLGD